MSASLVETVDVEAPVAVAWDLWSDVTRWPAFLSHVRLVDRLDERRFAWQLQLPGADRNFTSAASLGSELETVTQADRVIDAIATTFGIDPARYPAP